MTFAGWSLDPFWLPLVVGAAAAAILAARTARPRSPHPRWRLIALLSGLLAILLATVTPIEHLGNQVLWVNFLGFLLLTMVAPPLILLGAPLTLAFRAAAPSQRRRLRALYRSRIAAALTFPVFTWLVFAVVTYLWQFTRLTELAARDPILRDLQQFTLLLVGLLFWLPAVATDPHRWRLPYPLRALYVLLEMTHKALFGGMFLSMNAAMHRHFAENAPAWAPDPLLDQRMAILVLWLGGNLIFVAALIAIVVGWIRYEQRNQRRVDYRLALQREAERRRRAALEQIFQRPV
ncbi:cytochrome c oxidase assembly protein [Tepidiforma sp.]|uniref:cytochrome c oxidase assembly protein n=1 Tax=Tepidiforma sp. TaxID=2682230 RepID=UPI002ADE4619|nr:cytochrome c oxidase assembly protein [Tepidiforma sp.]